MKNDESNFVMRSEAIVRHWNTRRRLKRAGINPWQKVTKRHGYLIKQALLLGSTFHPLTMCDAIALATSWANAVQNEGNESYGSSSPVANVSSVTYRKEMNGEPKPINEFTRLVGELDGLSWRRTACCRAGDVSKLVCNWEGLMGSKLFMGMFNQDSRETNLKSEKKVSAVTIVSATLK